MDKFVVKNAECFFAAEKRSHLPVNITAKDRARNYPEGKGTFPPMWTMVWCFAPHDVTLWSIIYESLWLACVASVSVLVSEQRNTEERELLVLTAREMKREQKMERRGRGLVFVSRSSLLNRTETPAKQASLWWTTTSTRSCSCLKLNLLRFSLDVILFCLSFTNL